MIAVTSSISQEKKERVRAVYCWKYMVFTPNSCVLLHGTAPKHLFPVWSKERSTLILCVFEPSATKLQRPWVSPAISLLQCWNAIVVNFWTTCTSAFGCDLTLNSQYFTYMYIRVVPTNACATVYFRGLFHLGLCSTKQVSSRCFMVQAFYPLIT